MLVNSNKTMNGCIDGLSLLTAPPFKSLLFLAASILGFVCVVVDAHILFHYRKVFNLNVAVLIGVVIGIQVIYQWWRVVRYYSKIRELYAAKSEDDLKGGSAVDLALRISTGALTDVLFYCNAMVLVVLLFVEILLAHR